MLSGPSSTSVNVAGSGPCGSSTNITSPASSAKLNDPQGIAIASDGGESHLRTAALCLCGQWSSKCNPAPHRSITTFHMRQFVRAVRPSPYPDQPLGMVNVTQCELFGVNRTPSWPARIHHMHTSYAGIWFCDYFNYAIKRIDLTTQTVEVSV